MSVAANRSITIPTWLKSRKTREYSALMGMQSVAWRKEVIGAFDAVLIATDHDDVDYATLVEWSPLIIDTRNVFARRGIAAKHILKA